MSNVVRLRSASSAVWAPVVADMVESLYGRGDFRLVGRFAESFVRGNVIVGGVDGLAARAAARLGDFEQAVAFAVRMRDAGDPSAPAIEGYARARAGDDGRGEQLLREACTSSEPGLRIEAAYRLALLYWSRRDFDAAEATTLRNLGGEGDAERGFHHEMLGWIAVGRGQYANAGPHFGEAFDANETLGLSDDWRRQRLLQVLTIIAIETLDFSLLRGRPPRIATVEGEAREAACYATQNLGWLALCAGKQVDALDDFQRARSFATTPALIAMTEVNLATYYRVREARQCAADHLQVARKYLRLQDWAKANADERMGLLEYAIEAYQLDPFTAGEMLTRFLSSELRRFAALAFEQAAPPAEAIECTARGVLEAIHGRRESAVALLTNAVAAWNAIGYKFREATTALLLHRLSGNAQHLDAARRIVRSVPRSWLAREVAQRQVEPLSAPAEVRPVARASPRPPRPHRAVG